MNKLIELFGGFIVGIVSLLSFPLAIYAGIYDFKADKIMWTILDISTVFVGVIRGLMYLFGWL
ncbi:hypothetical protein BKG96_08175 [Rodentibacter caecimuris]|uniref:Uncharacterized protein n=2 Tax=Rodentibacter caecimuris TaxID=1796644 RepID=A0A1V3KIV0_9PAST|nr:hypothetical protein [Rodentibacter heylii]OOF77587.1 hypothetical protein BKG96_08175 [Rodentibacter heylii]